jgi:membrane protein YqaA with SNARE-associated domain
MLHGDCPAMQHAERTGPSYHEAMDAWLTPLLDALALPQYGLSTLFVVALISATLLPVGSEPALFGLVKLNPELFWPAVVVATIGNTIGGAISWWMGYGAELAYERLTHKHNRAHSRALAWLERFGPKACLLSWLPIVGDPLCAVAGWLRLPFWPCVLYMAIGKFARYVTMTVVLLWIFPGVFAR